MKPVIVIAHPDDESIWCSSLLTRYPQFDWTIICCTTPVSDPMRAIKFLHASSKLGAKQMIRLVMKDFGKECLLDMDELSGRLKLEPYTHIFTHNSIGEYNHIHHKQIHEFIVKNYSHKKLTFFGYGMESTNIINLSPQEVNKKLTAINCYNHEYKGKPYSEFILKFIGNLVNYKVAVETFIGTLPDDI